MQKSSPSSSANDVNILLLGPTGVGKTTFINAFANYLMHNTLDDAIKGTLQAPITASFVHMDRNTFAEHTIMIGTTDDEEKSIQGESCTRVCRSFVFKINNRKLRLIDTPGVGDTRGVLEDQKNFDDILAYISQFEHLNGICILFKPNETRLNVMIRFCIKELLRHLHVNARNNITFVFTNARSTSFQPGESARLLRALIKNIQSELNVQILFTSENTFLLDNEAFRFLALNKNGISASSSEIDDYRRSWDHTIQEFQRLVTHILKCEKHATRDTVSLNEAQQLIRRLSRPIGEITTLIQANMQLAKQHRDNTSRNNTGNPQEIQQMDADIVELPYPRTVCTNKKCTETTLIDGIYKVNYIRHCHSHCYLSGVEEEFIGHEKLMECAAMVKAIDKCRICGCDRKEHMHITYELRKFMRTIVVSNITNGNTARSTLDEFIDELAAEKKEILKVCSQIAYFLQTNSLSPKNDDIIEYIQHFIQEEKQKRSAGCSNDNAIIELENLKKDYQEEIEWFKEAMKLNQSTSPDLGNVLRPDDIFRLVQSLYALRINGRKIKSQVEHIGRVQQKVQQDREKTVSLTENTGRSSMMNNLQQKLS